MVALALALAWVALPGCVPEDDSGGREAPGCLSNVRCVVDSDCPSGEHCNSAVGTPTCMALYCGALGAVCDEDAVCIPGFACNADNRCAPGTGVPDTGAADTSEDTGAGLDSGADGTGDADADTPEEPEPLRYVLIEDLGTAENTTAETAGVDIFGVMLLHDRGEQVATVVESCELGAMPNEAALDCNDALGGLDGTCSSASPDYVSLGGPGGRIVVSFGRTIEPGDKIRVLECGTTANPSSTPEYYRVLVGPSADPNGPDWIVCSERSTDLARCTVPTL